jgi:oxygen-independent coproporphyrinogen-3 oxidase
MHNHTTFNKELINRYDHSGPRYTSYPTAVQFSEAYDNKDYLEWAAASNDDPIPAALSLYLHIPFCNTICYYCGCSKIVTKDKSQAKKYVELLKQEIAMQGALFEKTRPVVQIHWGGGTPTFLDDDTIGEILDTIKKHFTVADDGTGEFSIEVDPRTVDHDRITNLRALGFNRISFGVQDFDPEVQQAINRVHTKEQVLDCINSARDNNFYSVNLDLMYGLPKQTIKSFEKTLQTTIDANPDRIAVYNYAHLPHMFKPQRRIDEKDIPSAEVKLELFQMAIEKLQDAGYVYIGMDHFAKEDDDLTKAQLTDSLQRNFQGYSTHANCDIIALGITAISSIGDNYCQNVKTLDEYEESIKNKKIPVYRGLELEPDDILRREIINQLLCNFKLDITRLENKWGINFFSYFESSMDKLNEMVDDGLLKINKDSIIITSEGRLLVRSICMKFDRYLQEIKIDKNFSKLI